MVSYLLEEAEKTTALFIDLIYSMECGPCGAFPLEPISTGNIGTGQISA